MNICYAKYVFILYNYLFVGSRSHTRRGSLVTLILGIVLGFSSALLFISSPSRTFSFNEYRGHNDAANDPHNGHDLWDESGPIADVG